MADASCTICLGEYDTKQRKPWDLSCGHCVCEECFNQHGTTSLSHCPECRKPVNGAAHPAYAMLRLLERLQVKSFPIGTAAEEDDGEPTTPPASPARNSSARAWPLEDCSTPTSTSPSAPCVSTFTGPGPHTNGFTSSGKGTAGAAATAAAGAAAERRKPGFNLLRRNSSSSSASRTDAAAASRQASEAAAAPCSRQAYCPCPSPTPSTSSSQQQQRLVSYPVLEDEEEDQEQGAGNSSGGSSISSSRRLGRPWTWPAWAQQPLQLVTVGRMAAAEPDAGWPLCGPSMAWSATSSLQRCCAACCCTYLVCGALASHSQRLLLQRLEAGLKTLRLPGSGMDAATWLLTVVLGLLAYHWAAGLLLLPLVGAVLLAAFFVLLPLNHGHHTLLPFKSAGVLLAVFGGCGVVSLASGPSPAAAAFWQVLVQVAPRWVGLLGVLLLMQVAAEAWERGASSEEEASFLLLVARVVALAGAAWGGGWGAVAALAPFLQKAYLCHQCGALVRSLQNLVAKHYGSAGAVTPLGEAPPAADHGLLLILLGAAALYLPPAAVAPAPWAPWALQALLVWAFRVLALGYATRTAMGVLWRTAEAAALPFGCLPDKSILVQLVRSYWCVLVPLVLVVAGDTFLCAAAPGARGSLQACTSCVLAALLVLELGCMAAGEVKHGRAMLQAARRRSSGAGVPAGSPSAAAGAVTT